MGFLTKRVIYVLLVAALCLGLPVTSLASPNSVEGGGARDSLTVRTGIPASGQTCSFCYNFWKSGYLDEYAEKLSDVARTSKNLDLTFEFKPVESPQELVRMIHNKELDFFATTVYPDGQTCFGIPEGFELNDKSVGEMSFYLCTRNDDLTLKFGDFTQLNGKNIGAVAGGAGSYVMDLYAKDHHFQYNPKEYPKVTQMLEALDSKEISAAITPLGDENFNRIIAYLGKARLHFSAPANDSSAIRLINELQDDLYLHEPFYDKELFNFYFAERENLYEAFTRKESEYILQAPALRIAVCTDDRPNSYYDGKSRSFKGIYVDLMNLVADHSGLKVEYVPANSYNDCLIMVQEGKADGILGVYALKKLSENWDITFSTPFLTNYIAVVGEPGKIPDKNLSQTVGIVNERSEEWTAYINEYFPDWNERYFPTEKKCFDAVSKGIVNFALVDSKNFVSEGVYKQNKSVSTISSLTQEVGVSLGLSNNTSPVMIQLLDKSIHSLRPSEILSCQINNDLSYQADWRIFIRTNLPYLILALLIITTILLTAIIFAEHKKRFAEQKTAFFSNMSHEIRTPLNGIVGMTQIAKKSMGHEERLLDCLNKIDLSCAHLLTIVNNILDLSKLEKKKMEIAGENFSLKDLLHSIHTIYYSQAKELGVGYDTEITALGRDGFVGDYTRITQVLMNLLSNALKFTPKGKQIRLTVSETSRSKTSASICFTVTDEGIGIPKENLSKIFNAYEQQGAKTAGKYGGSGLGLPISKQLVELMGGRLSVESSPGKGSSFCFTLPLDCAPEKENYEKLPGKTALAAGNSAATLQYLSGILSSLGISSDCAGSTDDAEAILLDGPRSYDYFFVDWDNRSMDLDEALNAVPEMGESKPLVIAYSAADYTEICGEPKAGLIDSFIEKPLLCSDVYRALRAAHKLETQRAPTKQEEAFIPSCPGKQILVAEDNEINMEILLELLAPLSCEVTAAVNGAEAVEKFINSEPGTYDLILMDIQMPLMNGYDATKTIRSLPRPDAKSVVIIAMTADAFKDDIKRSRQAGMNRHLSKPVNVDLLYETLSFYLTKEESQIE